MIIGVSGKIGSGKDEIGKIIQHLDLSNKYPSIWGPKYNSQACSLGTYERFINANHTWKSDWEIKKFADKLKDIICIILSCTREQLEDREFKEKELGEEWWYFKDLNLMIPYKEYEYLTDFQKKTFNLIRLTPRKLFTLLGTDCGRNLIHPNIWINSMFTEYKPFSYSDIGGWSYPNWVITDLRFKNELKSIKDRKGITIRVNHPKTIRKRFSMDENDYIDEIFNPNNKAHVDFLKGQNMINPEHISETELDNEPFDYYIQNDGTLDALVLKVKEILLKEKIINEA